MKRIGAASLIFFLSSVTVAAGGLLKLAVAPEVWYVKWQPDVKPKENNGGLSQTSYNVSPAFLYGLTLTAELGDIGVAGSYMMSKSDKEVSRRAGMRKTASLESEIRGLIQYRLGESWQMRNRILRGRFRGEASGVDWDYLSGGVGTVKTLPVDTGWFQGEILFAHIGEYHWEEALQLFAGAGPVIGYRFQDYSLPVSVMTFAVPPTGGVALSKVSFLNTKFRTHHLVLGLEKVSDKRLGWNLSIQRLSLGLGVTYVSNSMMHGTSWDSAGPDGDSSQSYGSISADADIAFAHTSPASRFELGVRYRDTQIDAGRGSRVHPGSIVHLEDFYLGPYVTMTLRFGAPESRKVF